jgi:hypothetical protein
MCCECKYVTFARLGQREWTRGELKELEIEEAFTGGHEAVAIHHGRRDGVVEHDILHPLLDLFPSICCTLTSISLIDDEIASGKCCSRTLTYMLLPRGMGRRLS